MNRQFGQTGGGAAGGAAGGQAGGSRARPQTVYEVQDAKADPKPVEVRTGVTDGRFTQVVSGEVKAGDTVIVGLATSKGITTGGGPPGAAPGGQRRGF
jgi:multidrug efflux pump subunit AcrA (membrane-fusion protein)